MACNSCHYSSFQRFSQGFLVLTFEDWASVIIVVLVVACCAVSWMCCVLLSFTVKAISKPFCLPVGSVVINVPILYACTVAA